MKTIEAVLKVSERCNIDCTYCYFFNKGDDSFSRHPALIDEPMMTDIVKYLVQAARADGVERIMLDFHGGEPLMLGKRRFSAICRIAKSIVEPEFKLQFSLQTNATLLDEDWIEILEEFQFTVGVSLDGPKIFNDIARVDKRGRGTYDRTVRGLALIQQSRVDGRVPNFGILSVAAPNLSGRDALAHIVDDLGILNLDFLLPIDPAEAVPEEDVAGYARFLCDAFDAWTEREDPLIKVRIFRTTMAFLSSGRSAAAGVAEARSGFHKIITIASNGDVGPDDTLRTIPTQLFDQWNVRDSVLSDYWSSAVAQDLQRAEHLIPDECLSCCWKAHCRGGAEHGRIINRFKPQSGFNNASGVCEALRSFYSHVAAYMLTNGLAYERLVESLEATNVAFDEYHAPCPFSLQSDDARHAAPEALEAAQ